MCLGKNKNSRKLNNIYPFKCYCENNFTGINCEISPINLQAETVDSETDQNFKISRSFYSATTKLQESNHHSANTSTNSLFYIVFIVIILLIVLIILFFVIQIYKKMRNTVMSSNCSSKRNSENLENLNLTSENIALKSVNSQKNVATENSDYKNFESKNLLSKKPHFLNNKGYKNGDKLNLTDHKFKIDGMINFMNGSNVEVEDTNQLSFTSSDPNALNSNYHLAAEGRQIPERQQVNVVQVVSNSHRLDNIAVFDLVPPPYTPPKDENTYPTSSSKSSLES